MKTFLVIFALLLPQAAASEIIIAKGRGFIPVAIRIDKKADHVAVPLTIDADIDKPAERLDPINAAIGTIRTALSADPDLEVEIGVVWLSAREISKYSFASSSAGSSSVALYALGALSGGSDVFLQTKKIYRAVNGIELPRDVSVRLGNTTLGIRDPETYRRQLLKMIRDQIAGTKQALGASGEVTVRGLEGPVLVTQKNDADVSLYLNYRIDIGLD
jgi:hypothetical protein